MNSSNKRKYVYTKVEALLNLQTFYFRIIDKGLDRIKNGEIRII